MEDFSGANYNNMWPKFVGRLVGRGSNVWVALFEEDYVFFGDTWSAGFVDKILENHLTFEHS